MILVTYDVRTEDLAGQRRLRRVAKTCENYGQRVQYSVFECRVNQIQYEELIDKLLDIIDEEEDSLRFYRLQEPLEKYIKEYGKKKAIDFAEGTLIL